MTLVIGIITTIITVLIIVLEVMIGYERGIRKNVIRTIMLILVAFLTLLITPPMVERIVRELILTNKLYDYVYGLTGVNPISYGFVQESAVNMLMVFLNPFVYVILFWVLKLVSFGIYLLIDRYIIKRKLKNLFPCPTRRSSIAGGVLGGIYAILIGAIFFMPVSAYSELIDETEKTTIIANSEEGAVSEMFGNGNYRIAVSYQRTPSYYFYKYTGSKFLGDAVFDTLSERTTEVTTVSVAHYIPSIAKVYRAAKILQGSNSTLGAAELSEYIAAFNIVVEEVASQELITGTDQEKLSLMKELINQSDAVQENRMLQAIANNMEYDTLSAMQQDMKVINEFSTLLEEKKLLTDWLTNSSELSTQELITKLEDELILQIADLLYSMNHADIIVPMITEKLLGLLFGDGAVGDDALNQIENFGDTKQDFIEVCKAGRQLAYLLNYDVTDEEARSFLEESINTLRNSKLVRQETLYGIEMLLGDRIEMFEELIQ